MDLTAARTPEELVDLMLVDAIVIAQRLPAHARVVDVGSGAGAPGLALALLRPDLQVTLVEPRGKRASFLLSVLAELGRSDVAIERTRGESLRREAWDVAVSRATLVPPLWLDLATGLVVPGGAVWVLVAHDEPPTHARASLEDDFVYTWPLTGARRRALVYRIRDPAQDA
jgi:16S rRNA (guanine527-N7)-methyltransferase